MKRHNINYKNIYCLIAFVIAVIFTSVHFLEASDNNKEDLIIYINDVSSIMANVDITIRNIGLNILPINEGVRHMDTYISQIGLLQYPETLSRQHKMILLSFKKLRMGLLLLSVETKDLSIRLIKSGTRLLKYAVKDIVDIAKKEGIIKREEKLEEKGGGYK